MEHTSLNHSIFQHVENHHEETVSVSVSAQDGIILFIAHGKAHMHSTSSLSSLPKAAPETLSMCVWLNTDRVPDLGG